MQRPCVGKGLGTRPLPGNPDGVLIGSHQGVVRALKLRDLPSSLLALPLMHCVTWASVSLPAPGRVSGGSSNLSRSVILSEFPTCLPTPANNLPPRGEKNITATLENSLVGFIKLTMCLPDERRSKLFFSQYFPKRNENTHSHEDKNVHSRFIRNSKKTWQLPKCPPTGEWMNRLWSMQWTLSPSGRKRWEVDNLDESHRHTKQKKGTQSNTDWVIPFPGSSRTKAKLSYGDRSQKSSYPWGVFTGKRHKGNFWGCRGTVSGWRLRGHVHTEKSSCALQMVVLYVGYDSKFSLKIKNTASLSFLLGGGGGDTPEPVGSLASCGHGGLASCTLPCKHLHSPGPCARSSSAHPTWEPSRRAAM